MAQHAAPSSPQHAAPRLVAVDLGSIVYEEALALQRALVERRRRDPGQDDLLLLCEHDPVVTTGRRQQTGVLTGARDQGELSRAVAAGLRVVEVERGGSATFHGPGQLVGYPIVRLAEGERDLHRVLRALEGAVADAVRATTGLAAGTREGLTGVWCGEKKVASIGVACRGWVTYHGFALNLDVDLTPFRLFRPCDLEAGVMASLASLGARDARRPGRRTLTIGSWPRGHGWQSSASTRSTPRASGRGGRPRSTGRRR